MFHLRNFSLVLVIFMIASWPCTCPYKPTLVSNFTVSDLFSPLRMCIQVIVCDIIQPNKIIMNQLMILFGYGMPQNITCMCTFFYNYNNYTKILKTHRFVHKPT